MKFLSVCFALSLVLSAHGQKDRFAISFSPLAALDYVNFPTIQAGVEYKLTPVLRWYNEVGIEYARGQYDRDTAILPSSGIKVKTELRYFFPPRSGGRGSRYVAVNAFFIRDVHNTTMGYVPKGDTGMRTDVFGVRKTVFGFNMVWGWQKVLAKRWSMESYVGVGVRFRFIANSHLEFNEKTDIPVRSIDLNIPTLRQDTDSKNGYAAMPNITMGIRILYRL